MDAALVYEEEATNSVGNQPITVLRNDVTLWCFLVNCGLVCHHCVLLICDFCCGLFEEFITVDSYNYLGSRCLCVQITVCF